MCVAGAFHGSLNNCVVDPVHPRTPDIIVPVYYFGNPAIRVQGYIIQWSRDCMHVGPVLTGSPSCCQRFDLRFDAMTFADGVICALKSWLYTNRCSFKDVLLCKEMSFRQALVVTLYTLNCRTAFGLQNTSLAFTSQVDGTYSPCLTSNVSALPSDPAYGTNITAAVLDGGHVIDLPGGAPG